VLERRDETRRGARSGRGRLAVRLVVMAVLLALVFGGLYAFNRFREHAMTQFFATMKPPPAAIAVSDAKVESVPQYLPGIGSVAAVHQVTVAPEVGGRITQIAFESGARVRAGDPLLQLNDATERADLANFQAQARLASANLVRAKELWNRQAGPATNVDQNQALLDEANAGIAKTEALIAQKLVRAPFAGELGIRQVDLGQYVNAGAAIVSLTDLSTVYVNFTLPEQNRAQIAVGQTVLVAVDAFPEKSFEAKITTIEPQLGADTRTIKVQATLANPDQLLKPGMFTSVRVALPPLAGVVTVPETAVDYTLYGDAVYVVREDGTGADGKPAFKVARTFVKVGERFANKVAIMSGLKAGDRVATSGQLKLQDGAAVAPEEGGTLATPASVPVH
jgi:multidrug efflux system membrane fusion protein